MILQNIVFPKQEICGEPELYFRVKEGKVVQGKRSLSLPKGTVVEFLTYFNSFSAYKWQKYTYVKEVEAVVEYTGKCRVSLYRAMVKDGQLYKELVCGMAGEYNGKGETGLLFCCDDSEWIYYISLKALEDTEVHGGSYRMNQEVSSEEINIAIGICTYRRENYVKKTLQTLENYIFDNQQSELNGHVHVFVSDNGNTLPLNELNGTNIHVVYNKNVGGAGGFGRCMLETLRTRKQYHFTHILLMDDDIVLEPETIFRTYQILSLLKEEYQNYIVGGTLLRLDAPAIQYAKGEIWQDGKIVSPLTGLDLRDETVLVVNEREIGAEYNGWWYCCIPMEQDFDYSFPMPVFIHGDDIEYGLRKKGKLILWNGIGVWHSSGENRKSSMMEYYDMRNGLICIARHNPGCSKKRIKKMICQHMIKQLLEFRYDDQQITMRGMEDFCKGVKFLKTEEPVRLNQEIMKQGYKQEDVSTVLAELQMVDGSQQIEEFSPYKQKSFSKKHILTLNGWLLPGKRKCARVPFGAHPAELYRCKRVLFFDPETKKGFVVERKWKQLFVTMGRCIRMCCLVNKKYKGAVDDFQRNAEELMTRDFWEKYLDL